MKIESECSTNHTHVLQLIIKKNLFLMSGMVWSLCVMELCTQNGDSLYSPQGIRCEITLELISLVIRGHKNVAA